MVSSEHRTGLYVAIPVYFLVLVGATYWAYRRMETMRHEGVTDQLSAHYLGGRGFGPIVTAGTIFASFFSGYTVVGIPNEAFRAGFIALRWIPSSAGILVGFVGTSLRLRKISLIRNHQSPIDFITDRYQSQFLRYTILTLQAVASVIYVSAQVIALKSTFNAMFGIDPENPAGVIVMFLVILIMEWAGGLSSVALTDSIQGFVMVLAFLILPIVVKINFGGWTSLDPETYPRPEFYQTPTKEQQWDFFQFSLLNISFFTLPHMIQRVYAARDLPSLKFGFQVMTIGPWLTMLVGVFLGTVGVQMLDGASPASPFSAILEQVMDLGGFGKGVGVLAFTSSLAAIMSTSDSLIIAISQLVTSEVIYPLRPTATPSQITWAGRLVSLVTVIFALIIGLLWDSGISDLSRIQFPLALMTAPTFIWGLFATDAFDVHPWCLAIAAIVPSFYIILIYFLYIDKNADAAPIDAGITGLGIQLALVVSLEAARRMCFADAEKKTGKTVNELKTVYPGRPSWDYPHVARFGEHVLTPRLLNKAMTGVKEPMKNIWYVLLMFFAVTIATPMVPENEPPLENGTFSFMPAEVRGIPWWAFKTIFLSTVPFFLLFVTISMIPSNYPIDAHGIAKEGIDPDLVELTKQEFGRRVSYDQPNTLVKRRRRSIMQQMKDLGMMEHAIDTEQALTDGQRRLSALVLKGAIDELEEVELDEDSKEQLGMSEDS